MKIGKLVLIVLGCFLCLRANATSPYTETTYSSCTVGSVYVTAGSSNAIGGIEFTCSGTTHYARIVGTNREMLKDNAAIDAIYNGELSVSNSNADFARLMMGQAYGLSMMNMAMLALNSGKKVGIKTIDNHITGCDLPDGTQGACIYLSVIRYCNNASTCTMQ